MPNILPQEWAVVAAAFVVFCMGPVLVAWFDARAARRAATAGADVGESMVPPASAETPESVGSAPASPVATNEGVGAVAQWPAGVRADGDVARTSLPPPGDVAPVVATVVAAAEPVLAAAMDAVPAAAPHEPPRPLAAAPYEFVLQDLRRVRLGDWPPASVRHDPERRQRWDAGQRLAESEQARIDGLALRAPFPPQAFCYAGADVGDDRVRVRFLLFPGLWPSAAVEAPAAAIVTISGEDVSGTVEAVSPEDLSWAR